MKSSYKGAAAGRGWKTGFARDVAHRPVSDVQQERDEGHQQGATVERGWKTGPTEARSTVRW